MLNPVSVKHVDSSHDQILNCRHVFEVSNSSTSSVDLTRIQISCKVIPIGLRKSGLNFEAADIDCLINLESIVGDDAHVSKCQEFFNSIKDDFRALLPGLIDQAESHHAEYAKLEIGTFEHSMLNS